MKPSCRVDNELVIQPQKRHLKMKSLNRTTKLKLIMNLLKIIHLWSQTQTQKIIHNIIDCKVKILPFLRFLLNKHKVPPEKSNKKYLKCPFYSKRKQERTFKTAISKKIRSCKSNVTKIRTGTQSIVQKT